MSFKCLHCNRCVVFYLKAGGRRVSYVGTLAKSALSNAYRSHLPVYFCTPNECSIPITPACVLRYTECLLYTGCACLCTSVHRLSAVYRCAQLVQQWRVSTVPCTITIYLERLFSNFVVFNLKAVIFSMVSNDWCWLLWVIWKLHLQLCD